MNDTDIARREGMHMHVHVLWGILMAPAGLFMLVCGTLKSEFIVYRLMVHRSRILCGEGDLAVFYLWPRQTGWDYDLIDAYQKRGGGLIVIHMALMQGSGEEWSKRIGLAWDRRKGGAKWGVLPSPVTLTKAAKESPIFKGFPQNFELADEFYWELKGNPAGITPLVTSPAGPAIASKPLPGPPKVEELDGKQWPVMWTTEVGPGRVFVSGVGHNYFTFNDPYFRIILLRAMAWTMNESFDPFKPLVTAHLER